MNPSPECTEFCAAMPECTVCHRRKKPHGRDSRDNGLCDTDCEGYYQDPRAGHLWPEEWREHVTAHDAELARRAKKGAS